MSKKPEHFIVENESLMREWNFSKNSELGILPNQIGLKSSKVVWWICPNGHEYDMRVTQRIRGQECPYCSGRRVLAGFNDLFSTNPECASQWDYEHNTIKPEEVSRGSHFKVWWKCERGHIYQQAINKKTSRKSGCPVCSGHLIVAGINDFATCCPELLKEWHPTKNGDLLPSELSKQSGRKIWWKCKYGHEWQATPHDRVTDNTGCPFCSQRRLTSFPEQALLFYVKKLYPDAVNRYKDIFDNGMELDIYVPSAKLAIEFDGAAWHNTEEAHAKEKIKYDICKKHHITLIRVKERTGNEWRDTADTTYTFTKRSNRGLQSVIQTILNLIDLRVIIASLRNSGPRFSSVVVDLNRDSNEIREYMTPIHNSLIELRPDLVDEWNVEKNGNLKPDMFGINSNDKVWWKCSKCGHEWQTTVIQRGGKRNSGCPMCAKRQHGKSFTKRRVNERGSLAENNPTLAAEWHPIKNGDLTPSDITEKRFANVWWKCSKCGHEWEASPNSRSRGCGCPCCSGRVPKVGVNDLKTLHPEIAKEWNYEKNGDKLPEHFLPKSGKKVWWRCSVCGYEWETVIRDRTYGCGCPNYRNHMIDYRGDKQLVFDFSNQKDL